MRAKHDWKQPFAGQTTSRIGASAKTLTARVFSSRARRRHHALLQEAVDAERRDDAGETEREAQRLRLPAWNRTGGEFGLLPD